MRTLLLTSSGSFITDKALNIFQKPFNRMKMAYIITASKGVNNLSYMERHKQKMNKLNFDYEEIDIEGKNEEELRRILSKKEVIYVEGGNTFYLLKAVRESGFDKVIKDLINKGIIYVGSSAGSYLCCPTIEMATWKHQDKYDRNGVIDFTGLNLVPFLMTVHYTPEYKELLKEKISQSKYPVKILTDEQALLIQGKDVQLIGNGDEIIL